MASLTANEKEAPVTTSRHMENDVEHEKTAEPITMNSSDFKFTLGKFMAILVTAPKTRMRRFVPDKPAVFSAWILL